MHCTLGANKYEREVSFYLYNLKMNSNFFKFKSVYSEQDKYAEQLTSRKMCFMIARPFSLFYNAF